MEFTGTIAVGLLVVVAVFISARREAQSKGNQDRGRLGGLKHAAGDAPESRVTPPNGEPRTFGSDRGARLRKAMGAVLHLFSIELGQVLGVVQLHRSGFDPTTKLTDVLQFPPMLSVAAT
jgi:hypothetical protein